MTYADPRRNDAGDLLCTVAAKCDGEATAQGVYECAGCEKVVAAHADQIEKLTADRGRNEAALELVRAELARRADAGEDARLSAVEEIAVRLGMDKVRQLGEAIEALTAAHAAVAGEHTHPVFACAKHEDQLPAWPAGDGADADAHLHR